MDLVLDSSFLVALGNLPHVAQKAPCHEGRTQGNGGEKGKGEQRKGGRDSERKGYYTFFIKFPGTKPHQSLSEIEGREREGGRMF